MQAIEFDPLFNISLYVSVLLAWLVLLITAALVVSKITRRLWQRYSERRQAFYLPLILKAVAEEGSVELMPRSTYRWGDRGIVEAALLQWTQTLSGFGLERISRIFEEAGFADEEIRRLKDWRWWARARAAKRLGTMNCAKASEALIRALKDPVIEVRLVCAWALGRLGRLEAVEPMMQALAPHSRLGALSLTHVILQMGPRTAPVLERMLGQGDPAAQALAIRLLGDLKDQAALPLLLPFVGSDSLELRIAACRAIGVLGQEQGWEAMLGALEDTAWEVRARAAWSLGMLKVPASAAALAAALGDRSWWVRVNAGEALARMGERGREALERALSHQDRFARDMAAQWLEELALGKVH